MAYAATVEGSGLVSGRKGTAVGPGTHVEGGVKQIAKGSGVGEGVCIGTGAGLVGPGYLKEVGGRPFSDSEIGVGRKGLVLSGRGLCRARKYRKEKHQKSEDKGEGGND